MGNRRTWLLVALALLIGGSLTGKFVQPGVASAQVATEVSCQGGSVGLDDCWIVLNTAVPPGGSFTVSLTNPDATFVECNTIPQGGTCNVGTSAVTFACPQGCAVGSNYRDVVQLTGGSGTSQALSLSATTPPSAASPCIGPGGVDLCGVTGTMTSCTGTDIFVGITSICTGIQSIDCYVSGDTGVTSNCNASSLSCVVQSVGSLAVSPCGELPFAAGVTPFPTNQPVTIGSSQAANPSCTSSIPVGPQTQTITLDDGSTAVVPAPTTGTLTVC